ncbi:unnamed protein product [Closterium sp. Naga37s-1]|nr:unnamed protein product [Closterium sp. Naga37s-1]
MSCRLIWQVSETLLREETGGWSAVSQEEAHALLHALTEQLGAEMEAMSDALEFALPPLPGPAAQGAAVVAPEAAAEGASEEDAAGEGAAGDGAAGDGVVAEGVAAVGAAAKEPSAEVGLMMREGAGAAAAQQLLGAEAGDDEQLGGRSKPQSFESLTRAAVFGRLKSLALLNCTGLREGQLVRLLRACGMLEELRVEGSDAFSDTVIAGSQLDVLTRLTVVGCGGVTADGIGCWGM